MDGHKPICSGLTAVPARLRGTAYPIELLKRLLRALRQRLLPAGRVVLILEACFSGRSDAGELVQDVSAPAMGPPVILVEDDGEEPAGDDGLALLAAASGDEFAVWDRDRERSPVHGCTGLGLFGEADELGGNNDGDVTIRELRRFVSRRINDRIRIVRPGARQRAQVAWSDDTHVIARAENRLGDWAPLLDRRHGEYLLAGRLLAERDPSEIRKFLRSCVYCPDRKALVDAMREESRKVQFCRLEKPEADRLTESGGTAAIETFLERCKCCPQKAELEKRVAALANPQSPAPGDGTDPATGGQAPESSGTGTAPSGGSGPETRPANGGGDGNTATRQTVLGAWRALNGTPACPDLYVPPYDDGGTRHTYCMVRNTIGLRPIGWISTLDRDGGANLAPYSFFNGCGDRPPMVMFAQVGAKNPDVQVKDSVTNARETGEFACNVVSLAMKEAMNTSTEAFDAGVDEFEKAGLTKAPGRMIAAPHVAEAPAVLECRVHQVLDLPAWSEGWTNAVVIGEVVGVHIRDEHLADGLLDILRYNPIARMGYMDYTTVEDRWQMRRPGE